LWDDGRSDSSLPTIYNVEVDWPRVHETAAVFKLQCAGFRLDWVKCDGKCRVRDALSRIRQTQRLKARFRGYIASASAETQTNVVLRANRYLR
jgi:hypothetical protein